MTLEQLRTFLWVARLGGVRRAAQEMNVSQPAVSARIASLEEELGVQLFTRGTNGVSLTRYGALLRVHANQITTAVENIKADIVSHDHISSLVRIGVSETVAQTWLPDFLSRLSRDYPKLKIDVTVDVTGKMRDLLIERALDLAILMGPISDYSVDNIELPSFELKWYKPYGMGEPNLGQIPVITYNRDTRPYREMIRELTERYGSEARVFPTNSLSTGFEMIASGVGVGALPIALGNKWMLNNRISRFDPGWTLEPLSFTVSYIADPPDSLVVGAAHIAKDIAEHYHQMQLDNHPTL